MLAIFSINRDSKKEGAPASRRYPVAKLKSYIVDTVCLLTYLRSNSILVIVKCEANT